VGGGFLPFSRFVTPDDVELSFVRLITIGRDSWSGVVGASLYFFAGLVVLAVTAIVGLLGPRPRTAPPLVAAAAVWSLTWIGVLLQSSDFAPAPRLIGYWIMLIGILVVVAGTILVWFAERRASPPPPDDMGAGS
jgi:hypothetical protein